LIILPKLSFNCIFHFFKEFYKAKSNITEDKEKENVKPKKCFRSTITFICFIQGNIFTNTFTIDIDYSKLISYFKKAIKMEK
jgi:hypothetical protein